eukprot:gene20414-25909_t
MEELNQSVTLGPCAIAHGNLSITISSTPVVSQPNAFSQGQTVVTQKSDITINQEPGNVIQMPASPQLADVVKALNTLGATPGALLAILQAIKAAGALQAEIQTGAQNTALSAIAGNKTGKSNAKLGLDFETMCLSNLISPMFEGLKTD